MQSLNFQIGIILVNYNGFKLTIECLDSLNEIKENIKVYIVDNASNDYSYEKLQEYILEKDYDYVTLIRSEINKGFAGGNNIAIQQAISEGMDYVILLNNDTVVDKEFVGALIEPFCIYENCYVTVSKIYYESDRSKIWYAGGSFSYKTGKVRHWRYGEQEDNRKEDIQKVTFATGCCVCISRECIEEVGLLSEEYFLYDEDTDYCLKVLESGHSIYYTPYSVIYHKVNASTKKKKGMIDYYMSRNRMILIKKHIKEGCIKAYAGSILTYLYHCVKGEMKITFFLKGIIDGIKSK